jgi:hypothetical protein
MVMYGLQQGREGLLIQDDGNLFGYALKRHVSFFSEDILVDPVRLHNSKLAACRDTYLGLFDHDAFEMTALRLARQGYTVIKMKGRNTDKRYGFAFKMSEMDSEMD